MAVIHSVFAKRLDLQLAVLVKKGTNKTIRPQFKTWPNKTILEIFLADPFTISEVVNNGLPVEFFDTVCQYVPLTKEEWTSILDLSFKTIDRYRRDNKNLPSATSEKIIQILEITSLGLIRFGTIENLSRWLMTPNTHIKKIRPADLLKNAYGQHLIIQELKSIV
jgi:putative toxin-antitoxin system antitoxin component (TIGR02293 family)